VEPGAISMPAELVTEIPPSSSYTPGSKYVTEWLLEGTLICDVYRPGSYVRFPPMLVVPPAG
jgi:hypothetical protein